MPEAMVRGRPREFDDEGALRSATALFWERGYEATSVSELCSRMGINPPSLYRAFGSKAELFLRIVDRYERSYWGPVWEAFDQNPNVRDAFQGFFDSAVRVVSAAEGHQGCLVTMSAVGLHDRGGDVARALFEIGDQAVRRMEAKLDAGVQGGQLPVGVDSLALAHALNAIFDGLALRAQEGLEPDLLQRLAHAGLGMIPSMP